jgi:hypothetical protein
MTRTSCPGFHLPKSVLSIWTHAVSIEECLWLLGLASLCLSHFRGKRLFELPMQDRVSSSLNHAIQNKKASHTSSGSVIRLTADTCPNYSPKSVTCAFFVPEYPSLRTSTIMLCKMQHAIITFSMFPLSNRRDGWYVMLNREKKR